MSAAVAMIKAEADIDSIVLDAVEPNVEYRPTELMKAVKRQRSVDESVLLAGCGKIDSRHGFLSIFHLSLCLTV
jgi:hypothetical protein